MTVLETVNYRIAQEALNKIPQYTQATKTKLNLWKSERKPDRLIKDNGHGFDLGAVFSHPKNEGSLGLTGMRETAELSGG